MARWTKKEDKALGVLYPKYITGDVNASMLEKIFKRSFQSVTKRASMKGLTGQEIQLMDDKELDNILKRLGEKPVRV